MDIHEARERVGKLGYTIEVASYSRDNGYEYRLVGPGTNVVAWCWAELLAHAESNPNPTGWESVEVSTPNPAP